MCTKAWYRSLRQSLVHSRSKELVVGVIVQDNNSSWTSSIKKCLSSMQLQACFVSCCSKVSGPVGLWGIKSPTARKSGPSLQPNTTFEFYVEILNHSSFGLHLELWIYKICCIWLLPRHILNTNHCFPENSASGQLSSPWDHRWDWTNTKDWLPQYVIYSWISLNELCFKKP